LYRSQVSQQHTSTVLYHSTDEKTHPETKKQRDAKIVFLPSVKINMSGYEILSNGTKENRKTLLQNGNINKQHYSNLK
jgi:hypothetical protein